MDVIRFNFSSVRRHSISLLVQASRLVPRVQPSERISLGIFRRRSGIFCKIRSYMPQRHSRRSSRSQRVSPKSQPENSSSPETQSVGERQERPRPERSWSENRSRQSRPTPTNLVHLIEQDAPLRGRSQLVLMYGPFQAEMTTEAGEGVATWLKSCLSKHGIPSLVRFDDRRAAQVFRRDQFQPWVAHLMEA
jgi:hypothetical protein